MRGIFIFLVFISLMASGQTKTGTKKETSNQQNTETSQDLPPEQEPLDPDSLDPRDVEVKASGEFAVYSKRGRGVDKRLKLCFQLSGEKVLNYCINDSTTRYPEAYKELFRKKDGDTTYVLLFIEAFTKETEKLCDGGRETKLLFVEWNTVKNSARVKQRNISSCINAITNMTKGDIRDWDGKEPLIVSYHKGGNRFYDAKFDPAEYKKGMQTLKSEDTGEEQ